MSRKLSRQQRWRIDKVQQERASRLQKQEKRVSEQQEAGELGDTEAGLIISHFGRQLDVEPAAEPNTLWRCHVRANLEGLVTGDRVAWQRGPDGTGVIEARLERQSVLQRPDKHGQLKPVAANIDRIVIVIAPEPEPHPSLIDRYLAAAEITGIQPLLLLNKADLLPSLPQGAQVAALVKRYNTLGYRTLTIHAHGGDSGLAPLVNELRDHTSVFVGQSGVGKSSIIKALLPEQDIRIGALSENTRKGTHTTTTARLFHLPSGGDLIDSPGIREFGLWHLDANTLAHGFIEFGKWMDQCRFRDCRHEREPGCGLKQGVETGEILPERLESFLRIRADMEAMQATLTPYRRDATDS